MRKILVAMLALLLNACAALGPYGDPDRITAPFSSAPGDAARGRKVAIEREGGHCILCHALPEAEVKNAGDIGPSLAGVGSRLDAAQLRRRVADITVIKPDAVMPAFHRAADLLRVAQEYRGRPVLDVQQVEDLVAYLASLR
jgi:sulfur-oxidizing protein SoxX